MYGCPSVLDLYSCVKVEEPNPDVKKPSEKKPKHYVFFFGTEN
jgi:hypothetical protein